MVPLKRDAKQQPRQEGISPLSAPGPLTSTVHHPGHASLQLGSRHHGHTQNTTATIQTLLLNKEQGSYCLAKVVQCFLSESQTHNLVESFSCLRSTGSLMNKTPPGRSLQTMTHTLSYQSSSTTANFSETLLREEQN